MKSILLLFFFGGGLIAFGNPTPLSSYERPIEGQALRLPKVSITKSGPFIGIQRGRYTVLELGAERQWKRLKLVKPITHAALIGMHYNFLHNVIGADMGYWFKIGRLNFTYGANLVYRSNFDVNSFGFAPVIGYKIFQFHLQAGYHFLTKPKYEFETNKLFVSLRFVLINNRDLDVKRERKKKK